MDKSFEAWFKGSKVANKDGSPRIVFHGTESGDFDAFDTPAFFSNDRDEAVAYAEYTDTYGDVSVTYEPVGDRNLPEPDAFDTWPIMSDYDGPANKVALTEEFESDEGAARYFYWDGTENAVGDKNFVVLSGVKVVSSGSGASFRMRVVYGPTDDSGGQTPRRLERRVYEAYLSIKNPLGLPWQESNLLGKRLGADPDSVGSKIREWESQGYDGVVTVSDAGAVFHGVMVTNWIVFRPEQVRVVGVDRVEESLSVSLIKSCEGIRG